MHDGSLAALMDVINHYDEIIATTSNPSSTEFQNMIDNFLNFEGNLQDLNLTEVQKAKMVAFLETLTGSNVYKEEKLSDPF